MSFTTVQGAAATDATSFIGSAGVDSVNLNNVGTAVWLGAQAAGDVISFESSSRTVSGYTLRGGQGQDRLSVSDGATSLSDSFINLNNDNDVMQLLSVSSSTIYGGAGSDTLITGELRSVRFNSNKGDDTTTIAGATGSSIFGGQGNDTTTLNGDYSTSVIQGDKDADTLTFSNGSSLWSTTVNGNQGNDTINVNAITSFAASTLFGGQGNDSINASNSTVGVLSNGDGGNDSLTGGTGADSLNGGTGNDQLTGGTGADLFVIDSGNDIINDIGIGGAVDILQIGAGAGGNGYGTIVANWTATAATVNNQTANGFAINGANNVDIDVSLAAGTGGWSIAANTNDEIIIGSGNNDTIQGGAGADSLTGNGGNDVFIYNTGNVGANETLNGNAGINTLVTNTTTDYSNFAAGFTLLTAGSVSQSLSTGGQTATFSGATIDNQAIAFNKTTAAATNINISVAAGGAVTFAPFTFGSFGGQTGLVDGTDSFVISSDAGNTGENITGTAISDLITADAGNDIVVAGAGTDTVDGGAGTDTITGGIGIDQLTGGTDANVFDASTIVTAANADNVTDFKAGAGAGDDTFIVLNSTAGGTGAVADGTAVAALVNIGGIAGLSIDDIVADTAAALGANAVNVGNRAAVYDGVGGFALATDTGALYYDADGDFRTGVELIGTLTLASGAFAAGDFQFGV